MAVVIEEMEATVEPDAHAAQDTPRGEQHGSSPKPTDEELAGNLRRLTRWRDRLRAD